MAQKIKFARTAVNTFTGMFPIGGMANICLYGIVCIHMIVDG